MVIAQLSEVVNEYEASLPLPEEETDLWQKTKQDLEEKLFERAKGIMFRSKARWYEQGEKNTKYFYQLEKARYNAKTCFKMMDEQEQEIEDPHLILNIQKDFYSALYKEDQDVNFTMTNNFGVKVPEEIGNQQDRQITMEDLQEAIKTMSNNKTPGKDGIPADFYKVFWKILKGPFYDMAMECYDEEVLHETARQGVLNLIPKANKDTRYVKNLRPITLLNTDYKILEKAIANKMSPALEHIIHTDQRGFMKNRRISVNIRKMLDIIHQADKEDLEAVVLSLDFVKCFDKCSYRILHGSLEFFGFGEVVRSWTRILYKDFTVEIQNNGYFSTPIDIRKGVHQGGCCSSLYFLVIAEILALALRDNQQIEGITYRDIRNLLNQFADDMDIFSMASQSSLRNILEELDRFKYQSGFTMSYEKTVVYRIGSLKHADAQLYTIDQVRWTNEDINVLGVTIAHEEVTQKNYSKIVEKARQILNSWTNRGLSLMGKVQVVNTLVASLLVYKMMVLPTIPKNIVKSLDNVIREFLWNKKKAKIAYKILQNRKEQGGLGLVDLTIKDKSLKATWPRILYTEQDYASMVYAILRLNGIRENFWRCSLMPDDIKHLKISSEFWENVVQAWSEYNYYLNREIENQIIWYNSRIRIAGKPVMWNDAQRKGLLYVHQLFENLQFKSGEQIMEQFGLTQLRYNSLKVALPEAWKQFFMTNPKSAFMPIRPHNYDRCVIEEGNFSAIVYKCLCGDVTLIHNKYIKWRQDLGTSFCEGLLEFGKLHLDIYKVTNVTKYRSFQYRILQRAIVTNIQLSKWGLVSSDNCSFCAEHQETMVHLFVECEEVKRIWVKVTQYWKSSFTIEELDISVLAIMLNKIVPRSNHVVNFLCLVTKQYIYSTRCLKRNLDFSALKAIFRSVENIEKYIAMKNGKMSIHNKKWILNEKNENREVIDMQVYIDTYVSNL